MELGESLARIHLHSDIIIWYTSVHDSVSSISIYEYDVCVNITSNVYTMTWTKINQIKTKIKIQKITSPSYSSFQTLKKTFENFKTIRQSIKAIRKVKVWGFFSLGGVCQWLLYDNQWNVVRCYRGMKTGTCLTPYGADGCCVSGIFIYFRETVGGSERRNKTIAQWRTAAAAIT
jgi:hypothetical protein